MNLVRIIFVAALVGLGVPLFSQVMPPPDSGFPNVPPNPPPPVPLTGAEFLIAAGAAFGVKKFLDARKGK